MLSRVRTRPSRRLPPGRPASVDVSDTEGLTSSDSGDEYDEDDTTPIGQFSVDADATGSADCSGRNGTGVKEVEQGPCCTKQCADITMHTISTVCAISSLVTLLVLVTYSLPALQSLQEASLDASSFEKQLVETGVVEALAALVLDVRRVHAPLTEHLLSTAYNISGITTEVVTDIHQLNLAKLLNDTANAVIRMDRLIDHYFKQGAIEVSIPLAAEHQS